MLIYFYKSVGEKWGAYTHYWTSSNDAVDLWTMLAEYVSSYTCIECGKTVSTVKSADEPDRLVYTYYESQGWICPYCKEHKEEDGEYAQMFMPDRYTFIRGVPFAPEQEITLRVEDFWKLPEED